MNHVLLEFAQNNIQWIALALISGGMLLWQTVRALGAAAVSPLKATLMINRDNALVIDVRDASEWSAGHIPNAQHIALAQLEKRLPEIEKFKARPIIVNCQSGSRSANACGTLRKLGFEKVFNLSGGLLAWSEAGLPVTTK